MSEQPSTRTTSGRTRPAPLLQVRVIGPIEFARAVLADRTDLIRRLLGDGYQYHTQTRTARKAGQVRVYLTITAPRQEEPHGIDHRDG